MTPALLAEELKKLLDSELKEYTYTDSAGDTRALTIYKYYIDDKQPGEKESVPYIVIRPVSGEDGVEDSTAKCIIVACIRDESGEEAYLGLVNLLERVRQIILSTGTLGKKFPLKKPLKWGVDNEPNKPYYSGFIEVNYYVGHLDDIRRMPFLYE